MDDLIEFETTDMITAEKAVELLKGYIKAEKEYYKTTEEPSQ